MIKAPSLSAHEPVHVNLLKQLILLSIGWSAFTLVIMGIDMKNTWEKHVEAARLQAKIAIEKDLQYRFWSDSLGGVYAPASDQLQPNPYLKTEDRDITTPSGKKLTLIPSSYMTRKVHDLVDDKSVMTGHITSLHPIRPENTPDAWESKVLKSFKNGEKEFYELVKEDGTSYMRVMKVLVFEETCLRCHSNQGYKIGDIRGGLSVSIPMKEMKTLLVQHLLYEYLLYAGIWIIGLFGLKIGASRLQREIAGHISLETALQDFKLSLDNISEAVMMFDTDDLKLFYANSGAEKIFGLKHTETEDFYFPELIENGWKDDIYTLLAPLYSREKDAITTETRFTRRSDSKRIYLEMHIAYVIPRKGADRFLVVVRDISERKLTEKEKEQMQTQLLHAQKLESVGQLAAGIAHEINTPTQFVASNMDFIGESFEDISGTFSNLEQLKAKHPELADRFDKEMTELDWDYLKDEFPKAVKQSKEGLAWISSIVKAMQEFANPGSKTKVPEDINNIIEVTATVCRNEWKYIAEMTMNLDRSLPKVPCLKGDLGQVILNLITNAAHAISSNKAAQYDGLPGKIVITTSMEEDHAVIAIADNGPGIDSRIANRIFDPFFTTKEVGKGMGQGLAISRDVIENKHRGKLHFTTEIGTGTTFFISLPLD